MKPNLNLQWVVQSNLTNRNDYHALDAACQKLGIGFIGIDIIPFSTELPDFERVRMSIFYGSTTFNKLAYEDEQLKEGVFFDPTTFSAERHMKEWGVHMLNYGASVTTFEQLMNADHDPEKLLFIRPDNDGKSFAGEVLRFADYNEWYGNLKNAGNSDITGNTRIVVGEPYAIGREWRLWCVDKKVVAASQYRNKFKLDKQRGCPEEVLAFAHARCQEFTPHEVFVMDVCETGGDLYIVECNCMNAAGFYNADIEAIVFGVSNHFSKRNSL